MLLHYSINFEGAPIKHHGEIIYPLNVHQNHEQYVESMTAFVKADLVGSMRKWGFAPGDMVEVAFYFYRMAEEIIFFSWEKENLIESK